MSIQRSIVLLLGCTLPLAFGVSDAQASVSRQAAREGCALAPRFAELRESLPDIVGECLTAAWDDPNSGAVAQLTSRGTLLWRPGDSSALFTDGLSVWSGDATRRGPYPLAEALIGVGAIDTPGVSAVSEQGASQSFDVFVNSAGDAPDAAPGDGSCASAAGRCTVRAAINEANATAGPRRVIVPAGVYKLGIEGPGEDRAATGDLDVTGELQLIGEGPGKTFLQGAGLDRVLDIHAKARVTVRGLRVRRGTVWGDDGAGIRNAGTLTLVDANVSSNKAFDGRGGGIFAAPSSRTALVRTSVWHNKATAKAGGEGGGIHNQGTLWLLNATIANNQGDGGMGGGLHNRGVTLATSSTVVSNAAATGGGIGNVLGLVQLKNSVVAGSLQGGDCTGEVITRGYNLIQQLGDCRLSGDTTGNLLGSAPRFDDLIEDGPRAGSRDLLPDSPVIDAGTDDGCPADDLRNAPRPRDGRGTGRATCDIGAIEYQRE